MLTLLVLVPVVGALLLAARAPDAVADPWIGRLSDRALGRRSLLWQLPLAGVVLAAGFSDIFSMNCCWNGVLPAIVPVEVAAKLCEQVRAQPGVQLTVDLPNQTVTGPDGMKHSFTINPSAKQRLMAASPTNTVS